MKRQIWRVGAASLALNLFLTTAAFAQTAQDYFSKGQAAYTSGQMQQALDYFKDAIQADPNHMDSHFNIGAIYYKQGRYNEALEAFNKLLQIDPNDHGARYQTGLIYEKMNQPDDAMTAFGKIPAESSRYARAQENINRLKAAKANPGSNTQAASQPVTRPNRTQPNTTSFLDNPVTTTTTTSPSTAVTTRTTTPVAAKSNRPGANIPSLKQLEVQEFVDGFSGPTGVVVDGSGTLYVANFSKNTIYKVSPNGEKQLLASGFGINGPVGMTLDSRTNDLYIANHLDNSIARISQDGKVSIVATGLKKPYNIFLDEARKTLYVSQQESNSVARVQLN